MTSTPAPAPAASNVTPITSRGSKKTKLTPAEAIRRYADEHFTARGLCIRYSTTKSNVFDPIKNKSLSNDIILDQFESWCDRNHVEVEVENYGAFLGSLVARVRARMNQVYGSGFCMIPERFYTDSSGAPLANMFIPYNPPPPVDPTPPPMLLELLERIAPIEAERRLLVEWSAAMLQRPRERPIWGVILTGDSKCGKSSWIAVLKAALGGNHVHDDVKYPDLWDHFVSCIWAQYAVLAVEDQIAPRDADTKMKQRMSNKTGMFNIKNEQEQVRLDLSSRVIVTSNKRTPLRLDSTVRRWLAVQWIDHKESEAESVDFFERFYQWLTTPEAPAQIVHYLCNLKLEVYNPNLCPSTPTLQEMIGQSVPVMDRVIADYVAPGHAFLEQELLEFIEMEMQGLPKREIADRIADALDTHGYKKARRDIAGVKKRPWVWVKQTGKRSEGFSPEDEARMARLLGDKSA